jgi:putative transposase
MKELHRNLPLAGSRTLRDLLKAENFQIGRKHVVTLMKRIRI